MYASRTRKAKFSGRGENCQRNVTDLAGSLITSCRPPGQPATGPTTEHGTPVSRYEQLMAAGGPQMLATSNVWGVDAAVRRVLWWFCAADIDGPLRYEDRKDRDTKICLPPNENNTTTRQQVLARPWPSRAQHTRGQHTRRPGCGGQWPGPDKPSWWLWHDVPPDLHCTNTLQFSRNQSTGSGNGNKE